MILQQLGGPKEMGGELVSEHQTVPLREELLSSDRL